MRRENCLLFVVILLLIPSYASAQAVKSSVVLEAVKSSNTFPKSLGFTIPKNGNSRFWGASKLEYEGNQIWLHVYDLEKADFSMKVDKRNFARLQKVSEIGNGVQKTNIDLFIKNEKGQWQRLSSTSFNYLRYGRWELGNKKPTEAEPEDVNVNTLWLNARTKKNPVIDIDFISGGYMDFDHCHVLVIFTDGLKKMPVLEQLYEGSTNFSSFGIDAISKDEIGNLLLRTHYWSIGWTRAIHTFKWNGHSFVYGPNASIYRKDRQPIRHIEEKTKKLLKTYKSFLSKPKLHHS